MTGRLQGKLALVTGASSGIGRATAAALAREGAEVIATGRRERELKALVDQCQKEGGRLRAVVGDIDEADFVRSLAEQAKDADILVNSAGILAYAPLLDMTDEEIDAMFRTNVFGTLRLSRLVGANMAARGRGQIIMITSLAAREVYRFGVIYCATKHALTAITSGLRIELQEHGIKVHEIAPGMVATGMRDRISHPQVLAAISTRNYQPLTAEEVADVVVYAATAAPNLCPDLIELRPRGAA
jgi:3-hydroxy acid dehydrogenase/malonic semialdehyde reductase